MLENINIEKVLFLDIETVPLFSSFTELPETAVHLWEKKFNQFKKEGITLEESYDRAGIYAEFGKIICISFGIFYQREGLFHIRIKSLANDDEKTILKDFADLLCRLNIQKDLLLCAHNGKEFDFPYISRRMLLNRINIPAVLDVSGRKPWETSFLDTMELWKFGDFKHYTSLNLLAYIFGIPSPKADIDGSQVANVYWKDHNLERISKYCKNDVLAIMQLFLKYKGEQLISDERIELL